MSSSTVNHQRYQPLKQTDVALEEQVSRSVQSQQQDNHPLEHENDGPDESKEISTWKLVFNLINFMEGVGFLALPYAIKLGGITTVIAFFVVPVVMGYTANLLADCLDDEDEYGVRTRKRWNYQEIGMACWAPFKPIIWWLLTIILCLGAVSFIVLCGSLMSQQFRNVPITESQWACLGSLLVFPTIFCKQFSQIAWISLISLLALIASAVIAFSYEFQETARWNFHAFLFWDTTGVFVALSILTFSYSCQSVSVSMAADVSDQSKFKKAIIWSYLFGAAYKFLFAICGFLTYTTGTNEVILNNLPAGIATKVIATFFTLNVLLTYPLDVLVVVRNVEELSVYEKLTNKVPPTVVGVLLRIAVSSAILASAVWMPRFALINAFAGCFLYPISFTFPGLFHLRLKYNRLTKLEILVDVILVMIGMTGTLCGLVTTMIYFI